MYCSTFLFYPIILKFVRFIQTTFCKWCLTGIYDSKSILDLFKKPFLIQFFYVSFLFIIIYLNVLHIVRPVVLIYLINWIIFISWIYTWNVISQVFSTKVWNCLSGFCCSNVIVQFIFIVCLLHVLLSLNIVHW